MLRIHQRELEIAALLKNVPDRNPVNARRFHRDLLNPVLAKPVPQLFQLLSEGAEYGPFDFHIPAMAHADACAYARFVNVEAGAPPVK